jgi:hypothetical protein
MLRLKRKLTIYVREDLASVPIGIYLIMGTILTLAIIFIPSFK